MIIETIEEGSNYVGKRSLECCPNDRREEEDLVVVFRGKRMIFPEEGTRFQVGDRLLLIASYDVWQNYKKHMYLNKKSEV